MDSRLHLDYHDLIQDGHSSSSDHSHHHHHSPRASTSNTPGRQSSSPSFNPSSSSSPTSNPSSSFSSSFSHYPSTSTSTSSRPTPTSLPSPTTTTHPLATTDPKLIYEDYCAINTFFPQPRLTRIVFTPGGVSTAGESSSSDFGGGRPFPRQDRNDEDNYFNFLMDDDDDEEEDEEDEDDNTNDHDYDVKDVTEKNIKKEEESHPEDVKEITPVAKESNPLCDSRNHRHCHSLSNNLNSRSRRQSIRGGGHGCGRANNNEDSDTTMVNEQENISPKIKPFSKTSTTTTTTTPSSSLPSPTILPSSLIHRWGRGRPKFIKIKEEEAEEIAESKRKNGVLKELNKLTRSMVRPRQRLDKNEEEVEEEEEDEENNYRNLESFIKQNIINQNWLLNSHRSNLKDSSCCPCPPPIGKEKILKNPTKKTKSTLTTTTTPSVHRMITRSCHKSKPNKNTSISSTTISTTTTTTTTTTNSHASSFKMTLRPSKILKISTKSGHGSLSSRGQRHPTPPSRRKRPSSIPTKTTAAKKPLLSLTITPPRVNLRKTKTTTMTPKVTPRRAKTTTMIPKVTPRRAKATTMTPKTTPRKTKVTTITPKATPRKAKGKTTSIPSKRQHQPTFLDQILKKKTITKGQNTLSKIMKTSSSLSQDLHYYLMGWILLKPSPYPTTTEKQLQCEKVGLTYKQLDNWLMHTRQRVLSKSKDYISYKKRIYRREYFNIHKKKKVDLKKNIGK